VRAKVCDLVATQDTAAVVENILLAADAAGAVREAYEVRLTRWQMPIYEYRCKACGKKFEKLVRGQEKVTCPKCGKGRLDKLFSVFGVKSGDSFTPSSGSSCTSCSASSCEGCK
jgi:putative FmdB family regulatory protein